MKHRFTALLCTACMTFTWAYAATATGGESIMTAPQRNAADVNKDSKIDSKDASAILSYYSYTSTGGKDSLEIFLNRS